MTDPIELPAGTQRIVIEQRRPRRWIVWVLLVSLAISLGANALLYYENRSYYGHTDPPQERFHSGNIDAQDRIALLRLSGTITPPFTGRLLKQIRRARDDANVKGAVLVVDSPGGFVADSHQIYNELRKLSADKPVFVSMKRIAASGGYYIAMGAGPEGRVFAEPTTWTGSIGVIIPRYNAAELVEKIGVNVEPLTAGRFKDSLSPFRDLSPEDEQLWGDIIDDAYNRFVSVIETNRVQLSAKELDAVAQGQIFTADQALDRGLVDEIGFLEDAIERLKDRLQLEQVRVVTYYTAPTMLETLTGFASVEQKDPLTIALEMSVPRALYLCAAVPPVTAYDHEEE